jgi:TRAP-type C4-dicarboxylate transport system permease large subunit
MTWPVFWEALRGTAGTTGMIYTIIMGAMVFNYFIVLTHLPELVVQAIAGTGWPDPVIIAVLLFSYICLGCVFDATPAMIITLPFVLPIVTSMGYSPIWWGIVNVIITEIGLITPPIGINVFVLHGVAEGKYPLQTIFKGILPFLFADLGRISIIAAFPVVTLFLPKFILG